MKYWRTRDGRKLDPKCMACDHLKLCIARIFRLNWRMAWLSILMDEYARRCKMPVEPVTKVHEKEIA
jgi:hypothetical protein